MAKSLKMKAIRLEEERSFWTTPSASLIQLVSQGTTEEKVQQQKDKHTTLHPTGA